MAVRHWVIEIEFIFRLLPFVSKEMLDWLLCIEHHRIIDALLEDYIQALCEYIRLSKKILTKVFTKSSYWKFLRKYLNILLTEKSLEQSNILKASLKMTEL